MIDHLAIILEAFPGSANRTRCFTHILNLVAKCIMKQFDAPKNKKNEADDDDEEDAADPLGMALDELEDELEGDGKDDDVNWEFDMRTEMSQEEVEALEDNVKPVRRVLAKVSRLSNIGLQSHNYFISYARLHTPSKTQQPLFFPNGGRSLTEWPRPVNPGLKNR